MSKVVSQIKYSKLKAVCEDFNISTVDIPTVASWESPFTIISILLTHLSLYNFGTRNSLRNTAKNYIDSLNKKKGTNPWKYDVKYDTTSSANLYMFNSPTSSGTVFYQPIYRVVRSSNTSGMSTNFIYLKGSDMGADVQNLTSYQTASVKQALTTLLGIVNRLSFAIEAKLLSCDEIKFSTIKERINSEKPEDFLDSSVIDDIFDLEIHRTEFGQAYHETRRFFESMNRSLSDFDKEIEKHFEGCQIDDWNNQRRQGYFDSRRFSERIIKWFNFSQLRESVDTQILKMEELAAAFDAEYLKHMKRYVIRYINDIKANFLITLKLNYFKLCRYLEHAINDEWVADSVKLRFQVGFGKKSLYDTMFNMIEEIHTAITESEIKDVDIEDYKMAASSSLLVFKMQLSE